MFKPFLIHFQGRKCVRIETLDPGSEDEAANKALESSVSRGDGTSSCLVYATNEAALAKISPYYKIGAIRPSDLSDGM